jgi:hypothetical protein
MVGYSKQWCELWDQSKTYDFDIDKITKELYRGNYYPIKCEGFGFLCIYKDSHGRKWLAFGEKDGNYHNWKRYSGLIIQEKKRLNENSSI